MNDNMIRRDIDMMVYKWYGYGNWDAPYWFIGPEPGMGNNNDDLDRRCRTWLQLGGSELIDCIAHHHAFGYQRWHTAKPSIQRTWGQLIRLLLSFKGIETDIETIREYQRTKWGIVTGETCVIELCSIAAPSMKTNTDRYMYRNHRVEHIRDNIYKYQPIFVVMYGDSQIEYWNSIAGEFDNNRIRKINDTIVMTTPHPQKRGLTNEDWIRFGKFLRKICDTVR